MDMMQRIPKKKDAVKKIILRTIKLLFWGIILQGKTQIVAFSDTYKY